MDIFIWGFILVLALSALIVTLVYGKKYNKVPWMYLIIQFFITGIIAGVATMFSDSAISIAYLIMIMLLSFLVAVYFILTRKNYQKFAKALKEAEALHKQKAEDMAEEVIKEIEQMIEKDEK